MKLRTPFTHPMSQVHPETAGINPAARGAKARSAFTLVEMLIAVGLVVLMMTLFATIFQIATSAMSTQKGLAENDQRVRLVLTRLRNDLNGTRNDINDPNRPYRTFQNLIPWGADENLSLTGPTGRSGYFTISENNPDDDTDDVLALTVQFPQTSSDQFFGKAAVLLPQTAANGGLYGASSPNPGAGYPPAGSATVPTAPGQGYWQNQPDFDDVLGIANSVGNSQFAEVCYFLRRGTLYRRVLMIRQPPDFGAVKPSDGTPTDNSLQALDVGIYTNGTRQFWNDFDYSAFFNINAPTPQLAFHGTGPVNFDSLNYSNLFGLSNPAYRFGFNVQTGTTLGLPREYVVDASGNRYFIGRFTHGETSDLAFGYPGSVTNQPYGASPMNPNTQLNYDTATGRVGYPNGANVTYFAGPRTGEDILMTNVLKFDIKVFDPAASMGPDGYCGVAGVDDDGDGNIDTLPNGQPDLKELGWPGSDDGDFVDIGHMGLTGLYNAYPSTTTGRTAGPQNVPITMKYKPTTWTKTDFATALTTPSMQYSYPNTYYNPGYVPGANPPATATFTNRYDTWAPSLNLDADALGLYDLPPYRPFNYGPDGRPGVKGVDDDGNNYTDFITDASGNITGPDTNEIGWPGSDDQPVPLGAIQIKITFFDQASNQVREVTLVQSLYLP